MPDRDMNARFESIEQVICFDPGERHIARFAVPGQLRAAAESLRSAKRVGIVSGFFLPEAGRSESDGPPGAVALGQALHALGIAVDYVTDERNAVVFRVLDVEPQTKWADYVDRANPTHLVSIERLGRTRDGTYRNKNGEDVTPWHEPLDELFLQAPARGIVTIGIGDGGNEIGMGTISEKVKGNVHNGDCISSVIGADYCIVAGTSNWGTFGLIACHSILTGKQLLPTPEQVGLMHETLVTADVAVDGVTHRSEPTVDGIPLDETLRIIEALLRLTEL